MKVSSPFQSPGALQSHLHLLISFPKKYFTARNNYHFRRVLSYMKPYLLRVRSIVPSTHRAFDNKISASLFVAVFRLFYGGYYLVFFSVSWTFPVKEHIVKAPCFPFSHGLSSMFLPSPRLLPGCLGLPVLS